MPGAATTQSRQWLAVCALLLLSAVLVLERWQTFDEPLDRDIAGYSVLSHEMLRGRHLYSDLWERKPPLLFAIFSVAEKLVGYGRGGKSKQSAELLRRRSSLPNRDSFSAPLC